MVFPCRQPSALHLRQDITFSSYIEHQCTTLVVPISTSNPTYLRKAIQVNPTKQFQSFSGDPAPLRFTPRALERTILGTEGTTSNITFQESDFFATPELYSSPYLTRQKTTIGDAIKQQPSTDRRLFVPLPVMNPMWYLIDDEGHYIKAHTIIGSGDGVVVVRRDDIAVKMAIVHTRDTLKEVEENRNKIRREQAVWRRAQPNFATPVQGIVHCLDLPGDTIKLKYMSGGTLSQWLRHRERPSIPLQKQWIRQLAVGLQNLHQRRIIHSDIRARNILLDDSRNVNLADLGASTIMPIGTVMVDAVDKYNCSIWTDLCQLGLVIYEIVTGRRHCVSIYDSGSKGESIATFPSRKILPTLSKDIWARDLIEPCWKKRGYGVAGAGGIVAKLDRMKGC